MPKTETSNTKTPVFTNGIFITDNGPEALRAFNSRRSVIARRVGHQFYIFHPASAAIGHFTSDYGR